MATSPLIGPTAVDMMLMRMQDRLAVLEQTAIIPVGIVAWCAGAAPNGWLYLDGSTISATRYGQLVAYLGGTTLPDLRGRVVAGKAASGTFVTMLATGGEETHALLAGESGLPSHQHTANFQPGPNGYIMSWTVTTGGGADYNISQVNGMTTNASPAQNAVSAHNNLQPYIVLLPIIKF